MDADGHWQAFIHSLSSLAVQPSADILKSNIQYIAKQLGFSDCKVAQAKSASHSDEYLAWLEDGCAGDMAWLERNQERRVDPREILPGAKSVVTLALNYYPGDQPEEHDFKIARYSWNEDYHDIIDDKLRDLNLAMEEMGGQQRYYVDTGPVLERDFATDAGLGWNGKSTVQIHREFGTWFFLCELITTLDLPADQPFGDHCGKCTRCMDNCPTGAITGPHRVDARQCISYLTIEHLGSIPEELRPKMGNRIYGCDVCLEVCPWNRFAQISRHTQLHAKQEIFQHSLRDLARLSEEEFRSVFAKSPIKRIKHPRFIRNVCVALGNTGTEDDIPLLEELTNNANDLVREHAEWAIREIKKRA